MIQITYTGFFGMFPSAGNRLPLPTGTRSEEKGELISFSHCAMHSCAVHSGSRAISELFSAKFKS